MLPDWGQQEWLLVAALATAAFTGGTVLVSALLFLQQRVDTARARPIKLSAIKEAPEFLEARNNWKPFGGVYPDLAVRTINLHLYNRSSVPQAVTLSDRGMLRHAPAELRQTARHEA